MTRSFLRLALFAALAVAYPVAAFADPITITAVSRGVAVLAAVSAGGTTDRHTGIHGDQDSLSLTVNASLPGGNSASSSSTLTTDLSTVGQWSGTGTNATAYSVSNGSGDVSASGDLVVEFLLATPHQFNLLGNFYMSGDESRDPFIIERSLWSASLTGSAVSLFDLRGFDSAHVERSGLLSPGTYRFQISAAAIGWNPGAVRSLTSSASGDFDFAFNLTPAEFEEPAPTPEPASLLLLGTGLVAVLSAKRRRNT